jgi:hypothetical protein
MAMRKPRDFDSELKALNDKARQLKERKVRFLGELVVATGADEIDLDVLAGALVAVSSVADPAIREGWRREGVAFFQDKARGRTGGSHRGPGGAAPGDSGAASA